MKLNQKISKVMQEYTQGHLKTAGKSKVTDRKQALAIAYSEAKKRGIKS